VPEPHRTEPTSAPRWKRRTGWPSPWSTRRHRRRDRHDQLPRHRAGVDRVEIGYTWYAKSRQRSHVNTSCKLLLLSHAFDTLGCAVVGLRTDNFNHASQAAIERLGAKKDGVIRHHARAATAPCATPSCTASCAASGPRSSRSCTTTVAGTPRIDAC
jgi:hypothetical protein